MVEGYRVSPFVYYIALTEDSLCSPPIPDSVVQLEARLNRDLDAFEEANSDTRWPDRIWQTWKDTSLENWRNSWIAMNPNYTYTVLYPLCPVN